MRSLGLKQRYVYEIRLFGWLGDHVLKKQICLAGEAKKNIMLYNKFSLWRGLSTTNGVCWHNSFMLSLVARLNILL